MALEIHPKLGKVQCHSCYGIFADAAELKAHLKEETMCGEDTKICPYCYCAIKKNTGLSQIHGDNKTKSEELYKRNNFLLHKKECGRRPYG